MSETSFKKGEFVLHPQHGVGEIQSILNCSFSGQPEASYAQLYFERDDLTMAVLEDNLADTARRLISKNQARDLLEQMKAWKGKANTRWKARATANQAALGTGNPFEYFHVLKSLAILESEGGVRSGDREHLKLSLNLLTEELARALGKSRSRVRELLSNAIGTSL